MNAVLILALFVAGCASCPGDELRIVQPPQWVYLDRVDLAIMCRDPSIDRGCVVSRAEGDTIYVRTPCPDTATHPCDIAGTIRGATP